MIAISIEQRMRATLAPESAALSEAIDSLVGGLLASTTEFSDRPTDGFIPLREEVQALKYWAVGKVYMIKDQSAQPVEIEVAFAPDSADLVSGTVRCGAQGRPFDHKLENALLASPRETAAGLEWAYLFSRSAVGWERMPAGAAVEGAAEQ